MKKTESANTLSELYKLDRNNIDFVDINLYDDQPLYVDPILLWRSPYKEFHVAHAELIHFFEIAIQNVKLGKTELARRMCRFPEPENLIGLSKRGYKGKGASIDLGEKIFKELLENKEIQTQGLKLLNEFQFMIEGIGCDIVSDITANVLKKFFVDYTNRQCELHAIPVFPNLTRVFLYDECVWDQIEVSLPRHPITNESFLLTPKSIVRKFVQLDAKLIYDKYLRVMYRDSMLGRMEWNGIGKEPKVHFKDVQAEYPFTKGMVVKAIKENPTLRRTLLDETKRNTDLRTLEILSEKQPYFINNLELLLQNSISSENDPLDKKLRSILSEIKRKPKNKIHLVSEAIQIVRANTVLILGDYSKESENIMSDANKILNAQDYAGVFVKDSNHDGAPSPREEVLELSIMSRFSVALDFKPSGHLNELEIIKHIARPVAIIAKNDRCSTAMIQDISKLHPFIKIFTLEKYGTLESAIQSGCDWAEAELKKSEEYNREKFKWLDINGDKPGITISEDIKSVDELGKLIKESS